MFGVTASHANGRQPNTRRTRSRHRALSRPKRRRFLALALRQRITSITKTVNKGKTGMSPNSVGRPLIVPPSATQMIVQFAGGIRAIKVPVYKHTVVGHLQTLTEGTAIGSSRLLTKEGDWDYGKLNHWYHDYFLKEDGVSTGNQRPLDHARHEWQTAANAKLFYNDAKANLLMAGICVENGTPPFEILPHHVAMTEAQFTKCVLGHPPEVEYVSSKAHLAFSLDECKLLLATHDDTHHRAERTVRIGKDDDGECISAKSACVLSGMGGSHASFEPVRPGFVFVSESVDPAWMLN